MNFGVCHWSPLKLMGICDPGLEGTREHDPPFPNAPQMPPQIAGEVTSAAEGLTEQALYKNIIHV